MPKVRFGVTKDEFKNASSGATGAPAPKPGLYRAKVISIDWEEPSGKDPRFHAVFELTDKSHGGYRVHTYLIPGNPAAKWKWDQFLIATGLLTETKLKGEINTDRPQDLAPVALRLKNETYEGEIRAKENGIFLVTELDPSDADEDESDEDESDEEEEEDEPDADDEADAVDLDELDRAALKQLIKDEGLDVKVLKSMDDDALRAAIGDALDTETEDEEEEEEDDESDEADDEQEDYSGWSLPDLKKECEARSLKATGTKAALITRLEASDDSDPFTED